MTDERTQDRDNAYAITLRENRELRAERDRALDREAGTSDALDELRAERDELATTARILRSSRDRAEAERDSANRRAMHWAERLEAIKADRDRQAAALRETADDLIRIGQRRSKEIIERALAALARTEKP